MGQLDTLIALSLLAIIISFLSMASLRRSSLISDSIASVDLMYRKAQVKGLFASHNTGTYKVHILSSKALSSYKAGKRKPASYIPVQWFPNS
jgi:hypothetical protein